MTCEAKIGVTTTKKEKKVKSTKENESGNYQEVDEKKLQMLKIMNGLLLPDLDLIKKPI